MRRLGIAVLLLIVLGVGAWLALRWPSSSPSLDCDPSQLSLDDAGIARCGLGGAPLPVGQLLTAGGKVDLNRASKDDLAQLPGVGPALAQALVDARTQHGGFKSWDEVDDVPGVGEAKLKALKTAAEIR